MPEYDPPEYTSVAITTDTKWADKEIEKYCYTIFFFSWNSEISWSSFNSVTFTTLLDKGLLIFSYWSETFHVQISVI